jgi:hypothetical protein
MDLTSFIGQEEAFTTVTERFSRIDKDEISEDLDVRGAWKRRQALTY